jgi:polyphenol oxidase
MSQDDNCMKKQNNILTFENLSHIDGIVHGFSTKPFGSMRPSGEDFQTNLSAFLKELGVDEKKLVRMRQRHTNTVAWAGEKDYGKVFDETDGIITDQPHVFLAVDTGDCIPLLMYDKEKKVVAAVHAGWKGVYSEIVKEAIQAMVIKGSNPEDILVGIGPSIRVCCYEFGKEDVKNLKTNFPNGMILL